MFGDSEDTEDLTPPKRTARDFLREMLEEKRRAAIRRVELRDSLRPEIVLVCEVPTDLSEVVGIGEKAREASEVKDAPAFAVILSCMTLARFTRQILINGLPLCEDDEGSAFADPQVLESTGTVRSWRAVREFFVAEGGKYDDAIIGRLESRLTTEAGFNANSVSVEDVDPTTGR